MFRSFMTSEDRRLPIEFHVGCTSEIVASAECALMVSGSVSLELLARRLPAVVLYRVGRVIHTVARFLVNIPSFTLPNLIAGETLYPEFLSVGNPEPAIAGMVKEIDRLLTDSAYQSQRRSALERIASATCRPGASSAAANLILSRLVPRHNTICA
jgi:lipid-A-disaccharide synthase